MRACQRIEGLPQLQVVPKEQDLPYFETVAQHPRGFAVIAGCSSIQEALSLIEILLATLLKLT
jgi:hypothetical protein